MNVCFHETASSVLIVKSSVRDRVLGYRVCQDCPARERIAWHPLSFEEGWLPDEEIDMFIWAVSLEISKDLPQALKTYSYAWKADRGYYEPGRGWYPDEECKWWEDMKDEHARSLALALPRTELAWKSAFGLIEESKRPKIDKDEVRSRVDMLDLATRYGAAMRPNGRRATGKCPFHEDRLASLSLDLERKLWNCFAGCGGGDCFSFVMQADDVDFKTAVGILNEIY